MDFSPSGSQSRNLTGISVAVVAHLIFGYALVNGLAHKVVDVLKKPLEVNLIEEFKPPPPPPPPRKVLPPQMKAPPPAYVPPPQINVQAPPAPAAIAVVSTKPAPPVEVAPPVVKAAPPAVAIGAACPNHLDVRSRVVYPPQAQLRGLSGDVVVEFTVGPGGSIGNAQIARSTNAIFNEAALNAVSHLRCVGQGQDVKVRIPFAFRLDQ